MIQPYNPWVRPIGESLKEYGRGIAGGLLFSLPLLYTMEMWWTGFNVSPERLILYVAATFVLLVGYNRYAGLREDSSMAEVLIDSVEELGLGFVISAVVLYVLGRITSDAPRMEILGTIVIEGGVVAIGVSVGTAQLGGDNEDRGTAGSEDGEGQSLGGILTIAACGAVLFAANVAPTEEIIVIATETSAFKLLLLCLASIVMGGLILFGMGFTGSDREATDATPTDLLFGTVMTYAVAIVVSAAILWFFGRFEGRDLAMAAALTVVLAAPATLGASAGRLLLGV